MNTSYTILYVDDDMDDLLLIADAFEKYTDHLRVIHARNGQEGLSKLQAMNKQGSLPCLVILDINMPVMSGKEMLQHLRKDKHLSHLPVILFSTSSNPDDKLYARTYDADYITKPVNYSDLESLVSEFVTKCKYEAVTGA